jgi:hypothetical protein
MGAPEAEKRPMTVFVYVSTSKQVGDKEHIKVFANQDAAEKWFEENDPRAWRSNMRFWSEPHRPARNLCNASDCRDRRHLEDTEGERGSVLIPHRERPKRRPQPGLGWDRIPFVAPLSEDRSTTPRNSPINMAGPMS